MKLKELHAILNRPGIEKYFDDEVKIVISRPSLGPKASCEVSSVAHGFDWEKNKFLIYPKSPLVEKPDSMSIYDATSDLILFLIKEGLKCKRKQWYHRDAIRIFETIHGPDFQDKFRSLFK